MASHDLQEPLRKMLMFSDRLAHKFSKVLDDEGRMFITRIQNAGERMQALIKDILLFSQTSIEKPVFIETDLNNILNDVLAELDSIIDEKKAKMLVEPLPMLCVNPVLIRPLFHNLISNALKYARKNVDPVIRIYSEYSTVQESGGSDENKNKYCRIYVEDNGIGFEQKYSEQIFGMFKRLHLNSEFEGTGIGLALCKKIVEEHNGFITARSKVNEGSIFIISLPMQQPVNAPEKQLSIPR
jgi:light-regulated signal transduction histidine kinase (bacteriophytochrome)